MHKIKITVSFETDKDLEKIKGLLRDRLINCKVPKVQKGMYKKAYLFIKTG